MSAANPLAGLIGNYGDSDDESEGVVAAPARPVYDANAGRAAPPLPPEPTEPVVSHTHAGIHPAPIPHCPWSACYDEGSGFTYYWNQLTNAVTWEAPPDYLLALKLAQQHLHATGSTEVSAEEWQMYQQALADKRSFQNIATTKAPVAVPRVTKQVEKPVEKQSKYVKSRTKRSFSEDEDVKIELITSYYNSDSESNDESEIPTKPAAPESPNLQPKPLVKPVLPKNPHKKQKTKPAVVEYGPSLPPNQKYSVPIGPELPPEVLVESKPKTPEIIEEVPVKEEEIMPTKPEDEENQDESELLIELKNKAKILENLGGEIPTELQKIIQDENKGSKNASPKIEETINDINVETNIDDLLEEIEKKELPKIKSQVKIDMFGDEEVGKSQENSAKNSPRSGDRTPPLEELKALFPSAKLITEESEKSLFPGAVDIQENGVETKTREAETVPEKKTQNMYLMDSELVTKNRKKLRISNSVLPDRKKSDVPSYTTKYSQHIEGFSSERTGLGFSEKDEDESNGKKDTVSYGNGLTFTKGETLNEESKDDEALDDLTDLVEAKLSFLNQLQPCMVTPVQEMLIQMQTLSLAWRAGALLGAYWRRWLRAADDSLRAHEAAAAPPGWTCRFQRSERRYRYERAADGLAQWEYPAPAHTDMDICTTPPPPPPPPPEKISVPQEDVAPPPPPPAPPRAATPPPPPRTPPPPPPPACWPRVRTPPPPAWCDPPPPGCDDLPPPPLPPEPAKQEIGDELLSFYNDIAEIEKQTATHTPPLPCTSPEPPPPPPVVEQKEKEKEKEKEVKSKKKTKVKISSSIGMKQKSVSNLVAKWQQVADENDSD